VSFPFGDALIPERFDEHTLIVLVRPPDAPSLSEASSTRSRSST